MAIGSSERTRRDFLATSLAASTGLLIPIPLHPAPVAVLSAVGSVLAKLAENVAYSLIGSYVYDTLKKFGDAERDFGVAHTERVCSQGFRLDRRVYAPTRRSWPFPYIMYPLVARDDEREGVAQFVSFEPDKYFTGWLSGPTVAALRLAARDLTKKRGYATPFTLHRSLMPRFQQEAAFGRFRETYNGADYYITSDGDVRVWYEFKQAMWPFSDYGEAHVTYRQYTSWGPMVRLAETYKLDLP